MVIKSPNYLIFIIIFFLFEFLTCNFSCGWLVFVRKTDYLFFHHSLFTLLYSHQINVTILESGEWGDRSNCQNPRPTKYLVLLLVLMVWPNKLHNLQMTVVCVLHFSYIMFCLYIDSQVILVYLHSEKNNSIKIY